METSISQKYDIIDVVGALIVGSLIFGFLSIFLFTSHSIRLLVCVGWVVGFGLFHMVGPSKNVRLKCSQCGYEASSLTHASSGTGEN